MAEKKRHRSPNYPYLDLAEALNRLSVIYKQDRKAVTTAAAMLEHLGYSTAGKEGKSGSGGRAISALRQYGLIEDVEGNYRVSDAGFRLLNLDSTTVEWHRLVAQAAIKPPVFRKVLTHFGFELPSDTTLKSYLVVTEGFNPDSVNTFIRNLRTTVAFANLENPDYTSSDESESESEDEEMTDADWKPMGITPTRETTPRVAPPAKWYGGPAPDYVFSYQLSFPRGIKAELQIYGKDLRKQDVERLKEEVGDLAGAFDEEPVMMTKKPSEADEREQGQGETT